MYGSVLTNLATVTLIPKPCWDRPVAFLLGSATDTLAWVLDPLSSRLPLRRTRVQSGKNK